MAILEVRSAAKINLTLDVLGRRDDGYHLLQSLIHTLDWWDELRFETRDDGAISLSCSRRELENESNLCVRAARLFQETLRARGENKVRGAAISLTKNIPSGAGLGGGSGNAAATLRALNELHARVLAPPELEKLALQLGADVPLFLRGGCVLMEGIGEKLRDLPPLSGHVLLAQPPQTLNTAQVFARFDELISKTNNATEIALQVLRNAAQRAASTRAMHVADQTAGSRLSLLLLEGHFVNDLKNAARSLGVDADSIQRQLRQSGAHSEGMSGSGSCFFGVFPGEDAAQNARETLHRSGDFAVLQVAQFEHARR